jgi:hypothetical protein
MKIIEIKLDSYGDYVLYSIMETKEKTMNVENN